MRLFRGRRERSTVVPKSFLGPSSIKDNRSKRLSISYAKGIWSIIPVSNCQIKDFVGVEEPCNKLFQLTCMPSRSYFHFATSTHHLIWTLKHPTSRNFHRLVSTQPNHTFRSAHETNLIDRIIWSFEVVKCKFKRSLVDFEFLSFGGGWIRKYENSLCLCCRIRKSCSKIEIRAFLWLRSSDDLLQWFQPSFSFSSLSWFSYWTLWVLKNSTRLRRVAFTPTRTLSHLTRSFLSASLNRQNMKQKEDRSLILSKVEVTCQHVVCCTCYCGCCNRSTTLSPLISTTASSWISERILEHVRCTWHP